MLAAIDWQALLITTLVAALLIWRVSKGGG